jgi:hypothetical protein
MAEPFVRIEPLNVEGAQRAFEVAPQAMRDEMLRAMTLADELLVREAAERAPAAHGTLRSSIFGEEWIAGDSVLGLVASPLEYAVYVELGTKPHFPPIEPLIDWVRVKFHKSEEEARGIAFLVARKIAERGTLGVGMFNRAFAANIGQVERIFDHGVERALARAEQAGGSA